MDLSESCENKGFRVFRALDSDSGIKIILGPRFRVPCIDFASFCPPMYRFCFISSPPHSKG